MISSIIVGGLIGFAFPKSYGKFGVAIAASISFLFGVMAHKAGLP